MFEIVVSVCIVMMIFCLFTGLRLAYVDHQRQALKRISGMDPLHFEMFALQTWNWRALVRLWNPGMHRPEVFLEQAMYQGMSEMARVAEEVELEKRQWFDSFDVHDPDPWFQQPIPLQRWTDHGAQRQFDRADKLLAWWGYAPLPLADYARYRLPSQTMDLDSLRGTGSGPFPIEALRVIQTLYVGQKIKLNYGLGYSRVADRNGNKNRNEEFCQGQQCMMRQGTLTITAINRRDLTVDYHYQPERGLNPGNYLCGAGNFTDPLRYLALNLIHDREKGPEERRRAS